MDDCVFCADGDGDQVAVPPRQLLERGEQLVALGSPLCALHALLGFASGQLQRRDGVLGVGARLRATCLDALEQRSRRLTRVEDIGRVDAAAHVEQRVAALASFPVEQPFQPVEATGGEMRDRRRLVGVKLRHAPEELGAHRRPRQPAERDELAAREDRLRQRPQVIGDENDDRVLGRLLEVLEQRIRRGLVHRVRVEDQVHAARRLEGAHVQVAPQRADLVDQHLVAERLEHVQVRVRAALDAARVADQLAARRRSPRAACRPRAGHGRCRRARALRRARP